MAAGDEQTSSAGVRLAAPVYPLAATRTRPPQPLAGNIDQRRQNAAHGHHRGLTRLARGAADRRRTLLLVFFCEQGPGLVIQIWALDTVAYAYHGGRSLAPSHHGSLPTPCQAFEVVHRDFIPSPTTPSESVAATDSATILHRQPEKRYVRIDVLLGRMSRGATRSDPFADDAVDATMSKTCPPAVRHSRRCPRDRWVCRGRGRPSKRF